MFRIFSLYIFATKIKLLLLYECISLIEIYRAILSQLTQLDFSRVVNKFSLSTACKEKHSFLHMSNALIAINLRFLTEPINVYL